jgi:Tol biopolymer transport system component
MTGWDSSGLLQIYSINASSPGRPSLLTSDSPLLDLMPFWAPVPNPSNGLDLAFAQWNLDCEGGLATCTFIINSVDGGLEKPVYAAPLNVIAYNPAFSPDGSTIVFDSDDCNAQGSHGIWSVPASGGTAVPLECVSGSAFWSPRYTQDGRYIVSEYSTNPSGFNAGIWIMNNNGTGGSQVGSLQDDQNVEGGLSLDTTRCMRLDILQPVN